MEINDETSLRTISVPIVQEISPIITVAVCSVTSVVGPDIIAPEIGHRQHESNQLPIGEVMKEILLVSRDIDSVSETQVEEEEARQQPPDIQPLANIKDDVERFIKSLPRIYHIKVLIDDPCEWEFMEFFEGYPPAYRLYVFENNGNKSNVEIVTAPVMQYSLQSRVKDILKQ